MKGHCFPLFNSLLKYFLSWTASCFWRYASLQFILITCSFDCLREDRDGMSRAYRNLGGTYFKMGDYEACIVSLTKKLPPVKSAPEQAWLLHEIGRAHLELKNCQEAKHFGQQSISAAQAANDLSWGLNAFLLLAQAEGKHELCSIFKVFSIESNQRHYRHYSSLGRVVQRWVNLTLD